MVGNPARVIRYRFSDALVARLRAVQWWTLSEERLRILGPHIKDVEKFLEIVERDEK